MQFFYELRGNMMLFAALLLMANVAESSEDPEVIVETSETEEITPELIASVEYREFEQDPRFFPSISEKIDTESANEIIQKNQKKRNWNVLLYGQGTYIFPGAGLGIRYFGENLVFEGSASIGLFNVKGSLSLLHYFGNFYAGAGIGISAIGGCCISSVGPYVPILIGLQQRMFFIDLGVDIRVPPSSDPDFSFLPSLRCGFCF